MISSLEWKIHEVINVITFFTWLTIPSVVCQHNCTLKPVLQCWCYDFIVSHLRNTHIDERRLFSVCRPSTLYWCMSPHAAAISLNTAALLSVFNYLLSLWTALSHDIGLSRPACQCIHRWIALKLWPFICDARELRSTTTALQNSDRPLLDHPIDDLFDFAKGSPL